MKRLISLLLPLIFIFTSLPSATAAENVVYLISKPHQLFDGSFRNDELVNDLLPTGRLGKPLDTKPRGKRTWVIDGQLLDEIADMADGYDLNSGKETSGEVAAKSWLSRLALMTSADKIIALPYGNPDLSLAKRSAPSELRFYSSFGAERVRFHLNRQITIDNSRVWSKGVSRLSPQLRKKYTQNRQALTALSTVINAPEVRAQRAKLAILLSPSLNKNDRNFFSYNADGGVAATLNKLRVSAGKYQIASETGQVPVTVINAFDTPVEINLELTPLNSRVQVSDISKLTIGANSRTQLSVPFSAIAPGSTIVLAQITNLKGGSVGPAAQLSINITFFNSQVAWFTIGAALLLFAAALFQNIRRFRRRRNEK